MASPAAADLQNGISTPPTTATGARNPSPPTAPSTQPANPPSQPQTHLTNGQTQHHAASATLAANPAFPSTSLQDTGLSKRPRDARLVHLILANMGVHAYSERVPLQLLDFAYRYSSGILSDAIAYEPPLPTAPSAKRSAPGASGGGASTKDKDKDDDGGGISLNALRTAVASRSAQQFNTALPKEFMMELAGERNRVALPRVEREYGVRLPPERYCFTGVGWDVKEAWEEDVEVDEGGDLEDRELVGGPVGGVGGAVLGGPGADTVMGGMEDEDEFEEVFGMRREGDADMAEG
ncbi:transcription initiation factor IID, 31kD subunit-domain-containing protein [Massariosphaeria phaeospora]|uniref:Transcription initiation factor IID, 31kD subunit-domain-containing protein n=1 Tax=Massariosphaeria phaeospora TaxID=100035 RepID=A0A7C8MK76_9PLEO|nr:transcription initiation factor IID, 31kD subunit-domain-containing protein [Massariosphaeria phaeospora]